MNDNSINNISIWIFWINKKNIYQTDNYHITVQKRKKKKKGKGKFKKKKKKRKKNKEKQENKEKDKLRKTQKLEWKKIKDRVLLSIKLIFVSYYIYFFNLAPTRKQIKQKNKKKNKKKQQHKTVNFLGG